MLGGVGENGELFGKGHRGHLLKGMAKKSNVCTNSIPACQGMSKEKDGKKTPEETSSGVGSAFWD